MNFLIRVWHRTSTFGPLLQFNVVKEDGTFVITLSYQKTTDIKINYRPLLFAGSNPATIMEPYCGLHRQNRQINEQTGKRWFACSRNQQTNLLLRENRTLMHGRIFHRCNKSFFNNSSRGIFTYRKLYSTFLLCCKSQNIFIYDICLAAFDLFE